MGCTATCVVIHITEVIHGLYCVSPSCVLHSLSVAVKMNHHQQVGNFLSHTPSPSRQTLPFHSSSQHNHFDITPSSEELDTQVRGGVTAECRLSASVNGVSVLC